MRKRFDEYMDPFEYVVDGFVPAMEVPPSFDNSFVVTVCLKIFVRARMPGDCSDE